MCGSINSIESEAFKFQTTSSKKTVQKQLNNYFPAGLTNLSIASPELRLQSISFQLSDKLKRQLILGGHSMEKMKGITIRIDEAQRQYLTQARNIGISQSFILRRALNDYMQRNQYAETTNVIQLHSNKQMQD